MARYRTEFVAVGRFVFPLDMLRYDGCYPADGASVEAMAYALDQAPGNRERRVRLVHVHDGKLPDITPDRWRSFGWEVPRGEWVTVKL